MIYLIILIVLVVVVGGGIMFYNRLITLRTRMRESWSDIDVQLKRRYDLIPNLINTVSGYMQHEKQLLENITKARAEAIGAHGAMEQSEKEQALTGILHQIIAVAENYPQLKANQNFLALQRELADTENKIQAARRFYNTNVRDLNVARETFPSSLVAALFDFHPGEFFQLAEGEAEAVQKPVAVNFEQQPPAPPEQAEKVE